MPEAPAVQVVQLGDCTLDLGTGLLSRGHEPVQLRAKAYRLLAHLARNSGRVVTKSDLMSAVWGDVFVTEDSLTQAIREIRKALADEGQRMVRTVARRGYMLAPEAPPPPDNTRLPTVAVLRFANAGDAGDAPLVDGFAEDIINGLAHFRTVTVLAHNSTFALDLDVDSDWRSIGSRLGAGFLVRGSLQRLGTALEVSVCMIDAATGGLLWSENYRASGEAVFDVQDDITRQIVNRLVARLEDVEIRRSRSRPPSNLAAYELLLHGIARLRGYRPEDNEEARRLFVAAIEKDPDYGLAHSYLGLATVIIGGYADAKPAVFATAIAQAAEGVTLAPEEPRSHRILGLVRLFAREHGAAESHMRRALDLNPHDAHTMLQLGYLLTLRGRPLDGLVLMDKAERINPIHPDWYDYDRSMALYCIGNFSEAAACLERLTSNSPWRLARLAACLAQDGKLAAARRCLDKALEIDPNFSPTRYARRGVAFEQAADIEHLADGIELALGAPSPED